MSEKKQTKMYIQILLVVVLIGLLVFISFGSSKTGKTISSKIIPTGVPSVYGNELKISYDDVSATNPQLADKTIAILGDIDRSETLEGNQLQRYIDITSQISCEYCCGANSIIFRQEDVDSTNKQIDDAIASGKITETEAEQYRQTAGAPACGCAHSYAMRGLAKYLIKYHGDEFTNDQILEELGKWKTLFFPGKIEAKAQILESQGIETNYINLASNKYRGIEQGSGSSDMVGGC